MSGRPVKKERGSVSGSTAEGRRGSYHVGTSIVTSFRGQQPHKRRTDSTHRKRISNVCNAEGSEKKHLATAGARYVIVGTGRDRKCIV
jgi:hypothetical protein